MSDVTESGCNLTKDSQVLCVLCEKPFQPTENKQMCEQCLNVLSLFND